MYYILPSFVIESVWMLLQITTNRNLDFLTVYINQYQNLRNFPNQAMPKNHIHKIRIHKRIKITFWSFEIFNASLFYFFIQIYPF